MSEVFKLRKVVYYGVQADGLPATGSLVELPTIIAESLFGEGWTEVKLSIDGCTVGEVRPHNGSCDWWAYS